MNNRVTLGTLLVLASQMWVSLTFSADLEGVAPSLDRGDFSLFTRTLNIQPHGYKLINDPTGSAPANKIEQFEVRNGDCHFNNSWNDCKKDRERSEVRERGILTAEGSKAWYGWYFYVPDNWPNVYPTKTVLGQFHQQDSHPVWMFLNIRGGLALDDHSTGRSSRVVELIPEKDFVGQWHRIEMHVKWKTNKKGFLKIWINGKKKFDYKGITMTAKKVYFRYGVYRSFVSRYKEFAQTKKVPKQRALFANVRKSKKRTGL